MVKQTEYYHLISKHMGNRYFKVDWVNGTVIQVVVCPGEKKKGKPHCLGVYNLAISSFRGTYHWFFGRKDLSGNTNLLLTSENQFKQAAKNYFNKL